MTIKLKGSTDGSVSLKAPADTDPSGSDIEFQLPTTLGSANQFVKNSGTAGTLEYSSMVETSTGVGIGTDSPTAKLDVTRTVSDGTIFALGLSVGAKGTTSTVRQLNFYAPGPHSTRVAKIAVENTAAPFAIEINGDERMRIDASGNVGIGNNNPQGSLHVGSTVQFTDSGSNAIFANSGSHQRLVIAGGDSHVTDLEFRKTSDTTSQGRIRYDSADRMRFFTAGSERVRIDGVNVGIGTTSPASTLDVSGTTDSTKFRGRDGSASDPSICPGIDNDTGMYRPLTNSIGITTAGTERFRIMSDGDLRFKQNTTSTPGFGNTTTGLGLEYLSSGAALYVSRSDAGPFLVNRNTNGTVVDLRRSGSQKGNIQVTTTTATFNSASDHRLKENVVALSDGITRLKQLSPSRFNFIEEPNITVDGFIAHEAQAVVPEAVTGTHNEVDDNGNPVMQGMDYGKVTPLLTAALQEAIAKIETLETKVAALEAGS